MLCGPSDKLHSSSFHRRVAPHHDSAGVSQSPVMNQRIREPSRGVLDGIKKDAEANRLERLTGESQRGYGNAWSHGYLNQKPWHPMSYRNQRDLFLAEEAAAKAQQDNTVAQAEYDREAEFFRSTQLMSGRERERLTDQQQLGFMYQVCAGCVCL
jgi:hypothetical protein